MQVTPDHNLSPESEIPLQGIVNFLQGASNACHSQSGWGFFRLRWLVYLGSTHVLGLKAVVLSESSYANWFTLSGISEFEPSKVEINREFL